MQSAFPNAPERMSDNEEVSGPPRNNAMRFTQLAILGTALALTAFFAWRMFLQPRAVDGVAVPPNANAPQVNDAQIIQISPPQMRRVEFAAEARNTPNSAGTIVGMLPAGSLVDVTGQTQVGGLNWLRVTLPNDSSKSGFVREDQLASMGEGALTISPMDSAMVPGAPQNGVAPTPEVVGPIEPMSPSTFYVASRQANIRQDANAASARVDTLAFSTPLNVVAQRTVGARVWYQVALQDSTFGWISGSLLSRTPREAPIDSTPPQNPAVQNTQPVVKPPNGGEKPSSQIGEADNQEAMRAFGPGTTIRVDATNANLRKEPGATGNSVVDSLPRDTVLSVEDVRIVNGVAWYRVTSPSRTQGWVSGRTVVQD